MFPFARQDQGIKYDAASWASKEALAGIEANEQLSQECFYTTPDQYLKKK